MRRRLVGVARRLVGATSPPASRPGIADGATPQDREILDRVREYTMTGVARQLGLLDAVTHVVEADLPGAFVECGVWRGGSALAMLLRLQQLGAQDRELYLYDTFEGMTRPTGADTSDYHRPALDSWDEDSQTAYPGLFGGEDTTMQAVRTLLTSTGYPPERLHFVVGPVEETIPDVVPDEIAVLRLDTDWYESTRHELEHLYPRVQPGGVVIVDDYGHWKGCRQAVDEYFAADGRMRPLMARTDYTCRTWVRTAG